MTGFFKRTFGRCGASFETPPPASFQEKAGWPLMIVIAGGFLIAVIFMYFNRLGPCATMNIERVDFGR
jgi:hypothetical protein